MYISAEQVMAMDAELWRKSLWYQPNGRVLQKSQAFPETNTPKRGRPKGSTTVNRVQTQIGQQSIAQNASRGGSNSGTQTGLLQSTQRLPSQYRSTTQGSPISYSGANYSPGPTPGSTIRRAPSQTTQPRDLHPSNSSPRKLAPNPSRMPLASAAAPPSSGSQYKKRKSKYDFVP